MPVPWQTNDRSRTQSNRKLIWLIEISLWIVWRSAPVCFGSYRENRFPTSLSIHIQRSDIEWWWLRWLIRKHVVIVKKVWEFTAQPSAQWTSERLGRAIVVGPASKNDNKAHVSWVSFTIISINNSDTIAIMGGACWDIYRNFQSSVLIMGAANAGWRHSWMPPVVDIANSGCRQLWMLPSG